MDTYIDIRDALERISEFITFAFDSGILSDKMLKEIEEAERTIEMYVDLKESEV